MEKSIKFLQSVLNLEIPPKLDEHKEAILRFNWLCMSLAGNLIAVKNTSNSSLFNTIFLHTFDQIKYFIHQESQDHVIRITKRYFEEMTEETLPTNTVFKYIDPLLDYEGREDWHDLMISQVLTINIGVYSSVWKQISDEYKVKI